LDPCLLELGSIEVNDHLKLITATARTTATEATCPLFQRTSQQVHSHYSRALADLPCCGQRVRWIIQVRRFRCLNANCKRKLFSERPPTWAPAYARRTLRQADALSEVACELGEKSGRGLHGS
jgi:zinc-finger of transposase IS204/IS1001/IS1096/IS1165